MQERKARKKRDMWVRELEARDEEDKEIHAAREARRNGVRRTPGMKKAVEKHKAASTEAGEKWKEDRAELQLGVANSAPENGGNKGWGNEKKTVSLAL